MNKDKIKEYKYMKDNNFLFYERKLSELSGRNVEISVPVTLEGTFFPRRVLFVDSKYLNTELTPDDLEALQPEEVLDLIVEMIKKC